MTRFLAHLAQMALGKAPEGAIRLELPPRFAPVAADDGGHGEDWVSDNSPMPMSAYAQDRASPAQTNVLDSAGSRSIAEPRQPPSEKTGEVHLPPISAQPPRERRSALALAEPERLHVQRRRGLGPLQPTGRPSAPAPVAKPIANDREIDLGMIARSLARQERPSAPLSDGILARRTHPARDVDPVIHVTIDRIDVRAPAAPAGPSPRRRPMEPSVTLAEFLQGKRAQG